MDTLQFNHFIDFPKDDCTFAAARGEGNKLYLFLIFNHSGRIFARQRNSWQVLEANDETVIRHRSQFARQSGAPSFTCRDEITL